MRLVRVCWCGPPSLRWAIHVDIEWPDLSGGQRPQDVVGQQRILRLAVVPRPRSWTGLLHLIKCWSLSLQEYPQSPLFGIGDILCEQLVVEPLFLVGRQVLEVAARTQEVRPSPIDVLHVEGRADRLTVPTLLRWPSPLDICTIDAVTDESRRLRGPEDGRRQRVIRNQRVCNPTSLESSSGRSRIVDVMRRQCKVKRPALQPHIRCQREPRHRTVDVAGLMTVSLGCEALPSQLR
mmetsp:Transcript_16051/g.38328  ORF Transcript_16051/g.38328 Transcript_16051/m.38328 type:complete len:236 (+) Transcript_16051:433-1140(+)